MHYLGAVGYIKADVKVEAAVIHRLELDDGHLGLGDDLRDGRARETHSKQAGAILLPANDRSDDRVQGDKGEAAFSYACSFSRSNPFPLPPPRALPASWLHVCSSLAKPLSTDCLHKKIGLYISQPTLSRSTPFPHALPAF